MSHPYVVYEEATLRVLRTGIAQEGFLNHQAHNPGEAVLETDKYYDPHTVVIVANPGSPITYSSVET